MNIAKLHLQRVTLIDRRKRLLAARRSAGAVERELVRTVTKIIKAELREERKAS